LLTFAVKGSGLTNKGKRFFPEAIGKSEDRSAFGVTARTRNQDLILINL